MTAKKHLIIGAGPAALSALEEIRRLNREDEVRLVAGEDCLPYSPAALPDLLSGKIKPAELWRRSEDYFRDLKSTLLRGKEVTRVLPGERKIVCRDGSAETYDTLLIASGAEPARPPLPGWKAAGVFDFRTLADCRRLRRALPGKKEVAVLGAGPAGMNLAAALLAGGRRVHIIEKAPQVLPLSFPEEAAGHIRDAFLARGAAVLAGHEATAVGREKGKIAIRFSGGDSLAVDLLINAAGMKSRIAFLEGAGIGLNRGILTDRRMRTGIDGIYAAGDAAEAPDLFTGEPQIHADIASAVRQGRVAGANMTGGKASYEGGLNVTACNFFGRRAFSLGLPRPTGSSGCVRKQQDERTGRYREIVFQDRRIVGAVLVNEEVDPGLILSLIKGRVDLTPHWEALFDGTKPLGNPWLRPLKFSPMT